MTVAQLGGAVHAAFGWNVLNLAVLPGLAIALLLTLRPRRAALPAAPLPRPTGCCPARRRPAPGPPAGR